MPSRPGGLWVRAEIFFQTIYGKEWSNIFWYKPTLIPTGADLFTDAHTILVTLANIYALITTAEVTIVGAQILFNDGTGTYGVEDYTPTLGTVAGALVPEDISVVVQRNTSTAGASHRGRIFVAGIPASFVKGSYLSPLGQTDMGNFAAALVPDISGVTSTYKGYNFSPTGGHFEEVIAWQEVSLLATNRKRRPRF